MDDHDGFGTKAPSSQSNSLIHLHILYAVLCCAVYYTTALCSGIAKSMCDLNVIQALKRLELENITDSPIDILCQ